MTQVEPRNGNTPQPRTPRVALPSDPSVRTGQATMVEQSRAQEQVKVQALMARQFPRDEHMARTNMLASCRRLRVAERAFFSYSRGGQVVQGPSVHLARELARCWGNIEYGIWELSRDDEHGQSEMMAWAWDLQTNTRTANVFIVPHKRDRKDKDGKPDPKALVEMRDIYENNANNGARRLRECIFAVLPPWFTEEAQETCRATVRNGADEGQKAVSLAERIDGCIRRFGELGVTVGQIAAYLGKKKAEWDEFDMGRLVVTYRSIQNGEVHLEDVFEDVGVSAAEIAARKKASKPAEPSPAEGTPLRPDDPDLTAHQN